MEQSARYLGSAALRNCNRWYKGDYRVFYEDIERMKTFIVERGDWMDKHFIEYTALAR